MTQYNDTESDWAWIPVLPKPLASQPPNCRGHGGRRCPRQLEHGIGGRVLRFGDSSFPGVVPIQHRRSSIPMQTTSHLGSHGYAKVREGIVTLQHLHYSNLDIGLRGPPLAFFASALPENHPELSFILDNVEEHTSKMVMTPETTPSVTI
ncbi:hypothetical protein PAXINDRAFT_13533 [Paxillus involutus ATCC 200175]|uniref:Uncharacterized protein n=1 Tax=Paxillus involutus ATCC 200175 TaxID=664439 RepID=A0A0C9TTK1_PAXIN|nr:hypothetical protein PAXINDRAFT_13533 [Paxillus involutus ATCC 200175]